MSGLSYERGLGWRRAHGAFTPRIGHPYPQSSVDALRHLQPGGAEHRGKVAESLIVGAMVLLLAVPVFAAAGAFDFLYPSGHRKDRWDLSYFPASIRA